MRLSGNLFEFIDHTYGIKIVVDEIPDEATARYIRDLIFHTLEDRYPKFTLLPEEIGP